MQDPERTGRDQGVPGGLPEHRPAGPDHQGGDGQGPGHQAQNTGGIEPGAPICACGNPLFRFTNAIFYWTV